MRGSLIRHVPDRPGHDWRYALDSSKMLALGWRPQVPFEQGLQETFAFTCSIDYPPPV